MIDAFEAPEMWPEYHAIYSVQVCELYNSGFFDNSDNSWGWPKYSDEQDEQLRDKILKHYWFREISITPAGLWKHKFVSKMYDIMDTYIPQYEIQYLMKENLLKTSNANETLNYDNRYKGRTIFSDFPETLLSANSDYASNGTDSEDERIYEHTKNQNTDKDWIARLNELETDINNIDLKIINRLEPMFCCLLTSYVNGA